MSVISEVHEPPVPQSYRHHRRVVTSRDGIRLGEAQLKWYDIRRPDVAIADALVEETRAFLVAETESKRLDLGRELGFVMLHIGDSPHGPNAVALLIVCTWRSANEVWESAYFRPVAGGAYQRVAATDHRATFCVWELAAVWHERQAWTRYLESARDEAAGKTYLADRFSGTV
jgi:hypothetical protein